MPNRIIKESICTSDSVDKLSWFEEVLFYRLIVSCDDYGRYDGRPAIIKNRLFPLKDNLTVKAVSDAINTLASAELVTLYMFEGKPYLYLPTWNEHQSVRAKKSRYPSPEDSVITSASTCKQMHADESKCPRNPIQSNPIQSESNANAITRPREQNPRVRETVRGEDRFEEFWAAYPRKNGGDIRMAYREWLVALDTGAEQQKLIDAAQELADRTTPEDLPYVPSAEKWLRNKAWMQKPAEKQRGKKKSYTTGEEYKAPKPTANPSDLRKLVEGI